MYVLPYGQMSLWGLIYKPQMYDFLYIFSFLILLNYLYINPIKDLNLSLRNNLKKISRLKGIYRIGPHNIDIISVIFGSLLGDGYAEKRLKGIGTRISFYQESSHVDYLLNIHNFFSQLDYCNPKIPEITTRLGVKGKVRKIIRFHTWTYTSFNWIHDIWYDNNNKKCVPECIGVYLTPLALAIWIMDDGSKVGNSLKLCTNSFTYNECLILIKVLNDNFNIKATIQATGAINQYNIYIRKQSMINLRNIVSPYIIPNMKYKII